MPQSSFKGSITTTGRSEALRLDKALFKAHPEFRQKAKIRAHVLGPGTMLVTLDPDEPVPESATGQDPVVAAYLAFLERDMAAHPERLHPFTESDLARLASLTDGVSVSDDEVLPDDVTL
ncbi:UNVERIFIED_CONTAM: type II toxin-antitoxin system PrlF family antitoxin [Methylobacteriaceae bacterium AG10]|nr:type II toxin-antitoxin system PrlF family antitoxin [Methylobacteriaceae bacterium AG10]